MSQQPVVFWYFMNIIFDALFWCQLQSTNTQDNLCFLQELWSPRHHKFEFILLSKLCSLSILIALCEEVFLCLLQCQVIKIIQAKIGMRSDAEGFGIYEVMTSSASFTCRGMGIDERMSDTISKWERLSRSGAVQEFHLTFRVCSYSNKPLKKQYALETHIWDRNFV